ncbi:MAG TPA: hypothetical protein ENI85_15710 [Deltaproteobacteria bacterium]|nr:hypothetical protein [Deltaproteobacteria bacterium]
MAEERACLENIRRWRQAVVWAPVFWFPLVLYGFASGRLRLALGLGFAGLVFAGLGMSIVWLGRCPGCRARFGTRSGGFRRIWDDATCEACGLSLFELRRKKDRRAR